MEKELEDNAVIPAPAFEPDWLDEIVATEEGARALEFLAEEARGEEAVECLDESWV